MRAILVWVLSYKPDIGTWWQLVKNDADRLRRHRPYQRENKRLLQAKQAQNQA